MVELHTEFGARKKKDPAIVYREQNDADKEKQIINNNTEGKKLRMRGRMYKNNEILSIYWMEGCLFFKGKKKSSEEWK